MSKRISPRSKLCLEKIDQDLGDIRSRGRPAFIEKPRANFQELFMTITTDVKKRICHLEGSTSIKIDMTMHMHEIYQQQRVLSPLNLICDKKWWTLIAFFLENFSVCFDEINSEISPGLS